MRLVKCTLRQRFCFPSIFGLVKGVPKMNSGFAREHIGESTALASSGASESPISSAIFLAGASRYSAAVCGGFEVIRFGVRVLQRGIEVICDGTKVSHRGHGVFFHGNKVVRHRHGVVRGGTEVVPNGHGIFRGGVEVFCRAFGVFQRAMKVFYDFREVVCGKRRFSVAEYGLFATDTRLSGADGRLSGEKGGFLRRITLSPPCKTFIARRKTFIARR